MYSHHIGSTQPDANWQKPFKDSQPHILHVAHEAVLKPDAKLVDVLIDTFQTTLGALTRHQTLQNARKTKLAQPPKNALRRVNILKHSLA